MKVPRIFRAILPMMAATFIATGCKDKEAGINFNPEFSINLMAPGEKWPPTKGKLQPTEVQKQVLERYGRPDFFRILWNKQGTIMVRDQFSPADKEKMKKAQSLQTSWVYLDRGIEVVYTPQGVRERRINDEIRLIARMGDPEGVRQISGGMVEWTFYSTGRIIKLYNGSIVETREFPPMPGFMK